MSSTENPLVTELIELFYWLVANKEDLNDHIVLSTDQEGQWHGAEPAISIPLSVNGFKIEAQIVPNKASVFFTLKGESLAQVSFARVYGGIIYSWNYLAMAYAVLSHLKMRLAEQAMLNLLEIEVYLN